VGRVTLVVTSGTGGTAIGGGVYDVGTVVPVGATASNGFNFTGWTGTGLSNPNASAASVTIAEGTGQNAWIQTVNAGFVAGAPEQLGTITFPDAIASGQTGVTATTSTMPAVFVNSGATPETITSLATTGDYQPTANLPITIQPGASAGITVTFAPSALGPRAGLLTAVSNSSANPVAQFILQGTGVTVIPPPTATVVLPGGATYSRVDCGGPVNVTANFTGTSPGLPITALTATLDGTALSLSPSGLGTLAAGATASPSVSAAGLHTVVVTTTDSHGNTASATATFTVNVTTSPPPSISISSPVSGSTLTYTAGNPPLGVALNVGATAGFGDITALSAVLVNPDSSQTPITLATTGVGGSGATGSPTATGTATLSLSAAGQYTVTVTATDGCNTSNASTSFTITVVYPPPTATTVLPGGGTYTRIDCAGPASVPVNFTGSSVGLPISSLTATLDGTAISLSASGLGTETATGAATLSVTAPGLHTVVVSATDSHGNTTASTATFTVNVTTSPPPAISISAPVSGSTLAYTAGSPPLAIALNVGATAGFGNITALSAALVNPGSSQTPITLATTGVGASPSATGTATLNLSTAGQYTVTVTATDGCNTSTTSTTFTITVVDPPPTATINAPSQVYSGSPVNVTSTALAAGGNLTLHSIEWESPSGTWTVNTVPASGAESDRTLAITFPTTGVWTLRAGASTDNGVTWVYSPNVLVTVVPGITTYTFESMSVPASGQQLWYAPSSIVQQTYQVQHLNQ
jgi:hypothetical protein